MFKEFHAKNLAEFIWNLTKTELHLGPCNPKKREQLSGCDPGFGRGLEVHPEAQTPGHGKNTPNPAL
jgi:hypothetical protein